MTGQPLLHSEIADCLGLKLDYDLLGSGGWATLPVTYYSLLRTLPETNPHMDDAYTMLIKRTSYEIESVIRYLDIYPTHICIQGSLLVAVRE